MSLITNPEYLIQLLRVQYIRSEDPPAERIITFNSGAQSGNTLENDYISEPIPERALCYSPNLSNVLPPEIAQKQLKLKKQPKAWNAAVTQDAELLREKEALEKRKLMAGAKKSGEVSKDSAVTTTATVNATGDKSASANPQTAGQDDSKSAPKILQKKSNVSSSGMTSDEPKKPEMVFQKEEVKGKIVQKSSLLSMKMKQGGMSNPFAKDYSFVSGKSEQGPITLKIYFPASNFNAVGSQTNLDAAASGARKALQVVIKRDATVEEVIGFSLYCYVEDKRLPSITAKDSLYSVVAAWNLRIVEDDGQIDEDFPALERSRKIQKFSFDQFALVFNVKLARQISEKAGLSLGKSSGAQAKLSVESSKSSSSVTRSLKDLSKQGDVKPSSTTIGQSSATSKKIAGNFFIKVHLYSTLEVKQTTTVNLPGDMLLSEVLVYCCRKRKIDPNDYTLKMADTKTDVPLDKTLESLGLSEICLLKKDRGPSAGDIFLRPPEEINDEDEDMTALSNLNDEYTSVYKKYTVYRKLPMIMGRQDRSLAIDGDYIYIMPASDKHGFFENVKTLSFHASSVEECKQLKKGSLGFKLVVSTDNTSISPMSAAVSHDKSEKSSNQIHKFEFEAGSVQEAVEICNKITFMSQLSKRA